MADRIGRSGARTVELLMPFEFEREKIEEVTLGPVVLDHTLRWKQAKFKEWFDLMVEVSYINGKPASQTQMRQLRYPDADRIVQNFIEILPSEIREAVAAGAWPTIERRDTQQQVNGGAVEETETYTPTPEEAYVSQADPLNIDE